MLKKKSFKSGYRFTNWNTLYQSVEVTTMPWYNTNLDPDLVVALTDRNLKSGKFLDIGTGPGTQAIQLSKMGFETTGTDISEAAITGAKLLSKEVSFVVDDFLNTKLQGFFDFVSDRGCFHSLLEEDHQKYVQNLCKITKPGALLFFKQFSTKEKFRRGRHVSSKDIKKIFSPVFEIETIKESIFEGPAMPDTPKAIFAIMKRK